LLPWSDTSSATCTYLCLPLAARILINSGLLIFQLVVRSLDSETLHSTQKPCLHSVAILWHHVCCLCLPPAFFCLSKTLGYSGLLNFQLSTLSGNCCLHSVAISRHCICCPRPLHCLQQTWTSHPVSLQLLGCLTPWYSGTLVRSSSPTPLEVLCSALERSVTNSDVLAQNSGCPTFHLGFL